MKTLLIVLTMAFSLSAWAADQRRANPKRPDARMQKAPQRAPANAAEKRSAPKTAVKPSSTGAPRKKEINFEERVLEGLGDRGYESLSQTGNLDSASRDRLYRKRAEFDEESQYLLREMEYLK